MCDLLGLVEKPQQIIDSYPTNKKHPVFCSSFASNFLHIFSEIICTTPSYKEDYDPDSIVTFILTLFSLIVIFRIPPSILGNLDEAAIYQSISQLTQLLINKCIERTRIFSKKVTGAFKRITGCPGIVRNGIELRAVYLYISSARLVQVFYFHLKMASIATQPRLRVNTTKLLHSRPISSLR